MVVTARARERSANCAWLLGAHSAAMGFSTQTKNNVTPQPVSQSVSQFSDRKSRSCAYTWPGAYPLFSGVLL